MDEEFKVKFTIDLGDAERKVASFKEDLKSTEKMNIAPKIGDIGKEMNKVFNNIRQQNNKVQKNMFWSKEKKSEFHNFFRDLESKAYNSLNGIEKKYGELAEQLTTMNQQKLDLETELTLKDNEAQEIKSQIDAEMSKGEGSVSTWSDLVRMQEEYNKATSLLTQARKKAKEAFESGDLADHESWLRDIESIKQYRDSIGQEMQNFQVGEMTSPGTDVNKVAELQAKYDQVTKEADELVKQLEKIENSPAFVKKTQELEDLKVKYQQIKDDLQQNPLETELQADDLQRMNSDAQNLNNNLRRSGRELNANTAITEKWNKLVGRLKSRLMFSFVNLINPINIIRKLWSGFLNQNEDVANTFKMISQNLIKVFEPAMRRIADWFFKIMQYVNVFTKSWFGVDLFDKSVLSSEKTKKNMEKMNSLTAGFDELSTFNEKSDDDDNKTVADTTGLPTVDTSGLESWAKNEGKWIGDTLNWALEHPMETLGIALGTRLVGGLIGKGVGKLIGKGVKKLFGGKAIAEGAATGGTAAGGIFGKTLYTGMAGQAVTVGKLLGGVTLAAGGTALAIGQAADAGAHWQDLSTGAKAAKVATVGLGSAAAGLGAVMLGASGPVGWAVAGVVALTAFCVGMSQTQDGIDSVKKETEQLAEAQANAQVANQNYLTATNNLAITMSALEQAEAATGLSGAALDEQVKAGTLTVDQMTSAQLRVYSAYLQNQEMIKQLKEATEAKKEADKQAVIQALEVEAANAIEADSYDQLREKVVQAWKEGSISAEEGADILSRALANADDETQRVFGENIPREMQEAFNPDRYESGWRKFGRNFMNVMNDLGKWFSEKWQGLKNWWNNLWGKNSVPEPEVPSGPNGETWTGASYAVGTPYVPNDQLAMVHKGEAIIPAKYNHPGTFSGNNTAIAQTVAAMTGEISALRNLIQQGIPVTGEFRQRGSDLVATVERTKSRNGAQAISNAAFAR